MALSLRALRRYAEPTAIPRRAKTRWPHSPRAGGGDEPKQVLDAAVIGAAQSVKHYEIARYGTLMRGRRCP